MQMAFEQLKEKLDKEGLFAPEHKKPLPAMPKCVGLVTSKTGAALQDILNVTQRRYPIARFLLYSVTVQGNELLRRSQTPLRGWTRADVWT